MVNPDIPDPRFREAVSAIDAGDVGALERLLFAHPTLVRERLDYGEEYFHRPYLLWFVAENPIRTDRLPANVAEVTRTIVRAAEREGVESLAEQLDYTLMLVCTGRVPRECGVQIELIDLLVTAGATPGALDGVLAHRELAAARRLIEHGAEMTLAAAICLDREDEVRRLSQVANADDRQLALAAAALHGKAAALTRLIGLGADLDAYSPEGFHSHATALHHAVDSGSLEAVRGLVEAGASLTVRDRLHQGTPLDWAEYLGREEIAGYLRNARPSDQGLS